MIKMKIAFAYIATFLTKMGSERYLALIKRPVIRNQYPLGMRSGYVVSWCGSVKTMDIVKMRPEFDLNVMTKSTFA